MGTALSHVACTRTCTCTPVHGIPVCIVPTYCRYLVLSSAFQSTPSHPPAPPPPLPCFTNFQFCLSVDKFRLPSIPSSI
ncbi:hypothetical protein CTA1_4718 [Colletotrichum tanaceti]|uniref:Uncharacterized protein n=1 Tax=Colletotrichum tanaceti TaxID=1306861 RepID=A0A4U6XVQ8_9PEZI|nr:hypothetical protein CTA1_4718 [Colletotrichum tanaceti]